MTSTSTGTVAALLKEVYNAHTLTVESLTNHIEVLVRKCDRLTKFKDDILARGKALQRRYDQLCEEHRLTQMTLKDTTTSEADRSKRLDLLSLDDEIGSRFPGMEGNKTGRQQDDLGMDSCDENVSKELSIGEGERSEDAGGQRRLKLVAGRKRTRYSEEEKPVTKKKVKLCHSDTSPVRQEDCQRTQESRSGRLGSRATANNDSCVKTDTNSLGFDNNIVRKHENNHTKCDTRTEFITHSVKSKDESTKRVKDTRLDAPSELSSGTESLFIKRCEKERNSQKTSTQRQRMKKHEDILSGSSDLQTLVTHSGRTNLLRCGETESTPKKGDSSHVLFVPETCYPDSCGPDSSPVAMDTVGTGYLRGSGNVPGTTPRKSLRTKKQNDKTPSTDTATTPVKSSQSKKQNHDFDECRERSKMMTNDKQHSSVERETHQDSMCSDDADGSGDVSEVFLLPEARLPGAFISPLCNSTPSDSTKHTTCKIGASQKVGYHENPLCDKLGHVVPKFPSLHGSPLLHSPKHDSRKNLRRKSAGSPLLFDDDADGTATNHERSRVCQTSGDSHSMVRTRGRNRLGGRSDAGQADETVARGQLLSSIDASKQADSIFFRDTERGVCSLKTSRQRRVDSKVGVTKTPTGESTSRKLVQMTLSQHLQPNAGRVSTTSTVSRSDDEEHLLIERAKKASLQDLDLHDVPRNETNVPPNVTGTLASEFKEPMTPHKAKRHKDTRHVVSPCHTRDRVDTVEVVPETVPEEWDEEDMGHQLNGSVDPDIRLSAYIFTQSNQQEDSAQAGSKGTGCHDSDRERGEREIDSCAPSVVFAPLRRQQMAPPATVDEDFNDEEDCMDRHLDDDEGMKEKKVHEDSFDRAPKATRPNYAYKDVVRKHAERRQLQASVCPQCEQYFSTLGLSNEEKEERMKCCRHRDRFAPPQTPEHFWSVGFPDTQECEDRGYIHVTQARPSRFRRKRGLKKLFNDDTAEDLAPP